MKEDQDDLIEWEDNLEGREDSLKQGIEELETKKKEPEKSMKRLLRFGKSPEVVMIAGSGKKILSLHIVTKSI